MPEALLKIPLFTRLRDALRANFIAGMFIALPLAITLAALFWLWELMDGPLSLIFGFTQQRDGGTFRRIVAAFEGSRYEMLLPPMLGLCILILAVLLLGILVRSLFGRYLLSVLEGIVARVPFVGVVYTSVKQLAEAFVSDKGKSKFQSAVLVQFPMEGSWVIGFVTGSAYAPLAETMAGALRKDAAAQGLPPPDIITVFVPTTPLPTQGFTLVLPRSETRELPLSVEEAIKLVISGGIISNPATSNRQPRQTAVVPAPKPEAGADVAPRKA